MKTCNKIDLKKKKKSKLVGAVKRLAGHLLYFLH